jgi:hypothetical protein
MKWLLSVRRWTARKFFDVEGAWPDFKRAIAAERAKTLEIQETFGRLLKQSGMPDEWAPDIHMMDRHNGPFKFYRLPQLIEDRVQFPQAAVVTPAVAEMRVDIQRQGISIFVSNDFGLASTAAPEFLAEELARNAADATKRAVLSLYRDQSLLLRRPA